MFVSGRWVSLVQELPNVLFFNNRGALTPCIYPLHTVLHGHRYVCFVQDRRPDIIVKNVLDLKEGWLRGTDICSYHGAKQWSKPRTLGKAALLASP